MDGRTGAALRRRDKQRGATDASAPASPSAALPPPRRVPAPRGRFALAALAFVIALAAYARTLHPSVAGGDAGELMCVAHELGTPHPPGYPTFAMYTHAAEVTVLAVRRALGFDAADGGDAVVPPPLGLVQNAAHAVLSAGSVGLLLLAAIELTGSAPAGIAAAGLYAFAPNVWTYAVVTEVFPLNNLFTAGILLLAVRFGNRMHLNPVTDAPDATGAETPAPVDVAGVTDRFVVLSALCCGLALTNQHTSVVLVAPVALWVLLVRVRTWRLLAAAAAAFLAGLLPYAYLPWSSANVVSTNSWGQLDTWDGFWHHFLRREYGTFSLASKESTYRVADFMRCWRFYLYDVGEQTGFLFWPLAVVGAGAVLLRLFVARSRGPRAVLVRCAHTEVVLLLLWFVYCNFFNKLSNLPIDRPLFYGVQQRFWIQPFLLVVLVAALGFNAVARALHRRLRPPLLRQLRRLPLSPSLLLAIGVVVVQFSLHFAARDESDNYFVRDFGRAILDPLPVTTSLPNATHTVESAATSKTLVLTKGDIMINAARYVQVLESHRRDVILLDQELLTYPWYNRLAKRRFPHVVLPGEYYFPNRPEAYDMATLLRKNFQRGFKIFLAYGFKEYDYSTDGVFETRPFGVIQEVVAAPERKRQRSLSVAAKPDAGAVAYSAALQRSFPAGDRHRLPPPGRYGAIAWEQVVAGDYRQALGVCGFELMNAAEKLAAVPKSVVKEHAAELVYPVPPLRPGSGDDAPSVEPSAACLAATDPAEVVFCGLLLGRRLMEASVAPARWGGPGPTHVRRNLAVAYQTLMKFDPDNRALARGLVASLEAHLAETAGDKSFSAADRDNVKSVIEHYRRELS